MKSSYVPTESTAAATSAHASEPELEIEETDIRVLYEYGCGENDGQTLVGLGPPSSRSPVTLSDDAPVARKQPRSEPPGPWGSDEEDPLPPSLRPRKGGIWAAAVPLLLAAAAVVVFALRGLAPSSKHASAPPVQPAAARASEGTGLFVRLAHPDARVFLDGVDRGHPPVLVMFLEPGSHSVSISAEGHARYEQTVTITAGSVSTLEPVLVRATSETVTSSPEAAHARTEPSAPPAPEAEPSRVSSPPVERSSTATPLQAAARAVKPVPVVLEENAVDSALASAPGMLAASSNPSVRMVVDGRPVGKSPRAIDLTPGVHTVVFVHPTLGRKSLTVSILPGKTTNLAVDF